MCNFKGKSWALYLSLLFAFLGFSTAIINQIQFRWIMDEYASQLADSEYNMINAQVNFATRAKKMGQGFTETLGKKTEDEKKLYSDMHSVLDNTEETLKAIRANVESSTVARTQ